MSFYIKKINEILLRLFEEKKELYHLGEDILDPYGGAFKITSKLSTMFPNRVIGTPISEASITGFATGMALRGLTPILEIMFGDFLTLGFDQILNHLAKFNQMYGEKVKSKIIIRTPMGGYRGYGPTHSQSLEKYFVGIPGIQIISISDIHDLNKLYRNAILHEEKPTIIIENKSLYSSIYKYNETNIIDGFKVEFTEEPYSSAVLNLNDSELKDLTILTYGGLAKTAREIIKQRSIEKTENIQLISITNLNNLNFELLKSYLLKSKSILILEEGTESFGLAAEYSFKLKEFFQGKTYRLCAKNSIIPSARFLEEQVLPSKDLINKEINEIIEKQNERNKNT